MREKIQELEEYINNEVHQNCDYNIYLELIKIAQELESELDKMTTDTKEIEEKKDLDWLQDENYVFENITVYKNH